MTDLPAIQNKSSRENAASASAARLWIVLAAAVFFAWACYQHRFRLNDERYMLWSWRHVPSRSLYPTVFLVALPFFFGQWVQKRSASSVLLPMGLIMFSTFALILVYTVMQVSPPDFTYLAEAVDNRNNGGYYSGGALFAQSGLSMRWVLANYPSFLPHLLGHLYNKPPGLLLFCWEMIRMFGDTPFAAESVAIFIAAAGTLSIPLTYLFIFHLTANRQAAFAGASYLALCPGVLLFLPAFDVCYVPLTIGAALLWVLALKRDRLFYAAGFGLLYAFTLFITYLPGVFIFFLAAYALIWLREDPTGRWKSVIKQGGIAVGCFALFYVVLWLGTGFNPIATFCEAMSEDHWRMQKWSQLSDLPPRRLPGTIPWGLYSFALGSGWISYLLVAFYFLSAMRDRVSRRQVGLAVVCISQIVLIAVTGLVPSETARVWLFLLPALVLPIGLELSKWKWPARLSVYAALLILTTVISQSMRFILIHHTRDQ
jgi:hypothetical protein